MVKRILVYLKEMYPLHHALAGVLLALTYFLGLSQLSRVPLAFSWPLLTSALSLTLSILLIRVMDEFKDYEDDKTNFPDRPLPSGRVLKKDLKVLAIAIFSLLFLFNFYHSALLLGILLVVAYSGLMYKWFFIEKIMRKSLPLALLSHHPIVYFYFFYLILAFKTSGQNPPWPVFLLCIPLAFTSTNWELSRKIRSPGDETAYTTYSKIWGPRTATVAAMICQMVTLSGLLIYYQKVEASPFFIVCFAGVFLCFHLPYWKFFITLKSGRPLKVYAEALSTLALLSIPGQLILERVFQ